ncbi:MAG: SRPBCC domain-containing protein [Leptospiraceae bacterium]|nr:SRPBCC domain-containing protein [Leptospiraceae bacterium]
MQIHTEIEIRATADTVWNVLIDFPRYPEWNPLIPRIEGMAYPGEKISLWLRLAEGLEFPIPPCEVLQANSTQRELRWRGPALPLLDQILCGEHYFMVQSAGEKISRFVHGENFTGMLADLLLPPLQQRLTDLYSEMNRALRARCEGRSG